MINADDQLANISRARYRRLDSNLQSKLDCDPFKDDFNLFEWLFGKKKKKSKEVSADVEKKENVFKKIGNLFKKKTKD
jgi:hypothetical protein